MKDFGDNNMANERSSQGIHYSRYIASWINSGGLFSGIHSSWAIGDQRESKFSKWLRSLGMEEWEVQYICNMAKTGKYELEGSASKFLSSYSSLQKES